MHPAFSIAAASTFTVGIGTTLVASGLVLLREAPATAGQTARIDQPTAGDDLEAAAA